MNFERGGDPDDIIPRAPKRRVLIALLVVLAIAITSFTVGMLIGAPLVRSATPTAVPSTVPSDQGTQDAPIPEIQIIPAQHQAATHVVRARARPERTTHLLR